MATIEYQLKERLSSCCFTEAQYNNNLAFFRCAFVDERSNIVQPFTLNIWHVGSCYSNFILPSAGENVWTQILVPNYDILPNKLMYLRCNLQINWLYYLAFTIVAIGLIIYSMKKVCSNHPRSFCKSSNHACRNLTELLGCNLWNESSSYDKQASIEAAAQD